MLRNIILQAKYVLVSYYVCSCIIMLCEHRRVRKLLYTGTQYVAVARIPIQKKQAGLGIDSGLKSELMERCSVTKIMVGYRSERICQFPIPTPLLLFILLFPLISVILFYLLAVVMSNSPVAPHVSAVLAGKEKLSGVSVWDVVGGDLLGKV